MAANTEAKPFQPVGQNVSATRRTARLRRHARLRKKVAGTSAVPRLMVNRSARHIHVQLIDDLTGTTLAAASSIEADVDSSELACSLEPADRCWDDAATCSAAVSRAVLVRPSAGVNSEVPTSRPTCTWHSWTPSEASPRRST